MAGKKETRGIKNANKVKATIDSMNTTLKNLEAQLKDLSTNVSKMMTGDAEGPYWNGNHAKKFYNQAINNIKYNIADYKHAYNRLDALAVLYEQTLKEDRK